MKIGKEYVLAIIGGLFLLAYVLEAVTNPLAVDLATPYEFLKPQYFGTYPFTTAIILIRGLALWLSPLWLLSFIGRAFYAKSGILLIVAGLAQLYAIQEVATGAQVAPLEWSLSLAVAGLSLLIPTVLFFIKGLVGAMNQNITAAPDPFDDDED